jgi:hypothetical protein
MLVLELVEVFDGSSFPASFPESTEHGLVLERVLEEERIMGERVLGVIAMEDCSPMAVVIVCRFLVGGQIIDRPHIIVIGAVSVGGRDVEGMGDDRAGGLCADRFFQVR